MSEVIINESGLAALLERLADEIAAACDGGGAPALVGIRSRGEILAQRLAALLTQRHDINADLGTVDITLYRDDLGHMSGYKQPVVKTTEIDFDLDDRIVVLIDDVVQTGRSTRAAINALMDLGRPRAIRMLALVDRGRRELPISVDFTGKNVETADTQRVSVRLQEMDDIDEVVVE